ncbi:Propeptide PepSY amd peptidase M4 [Methylobacterium sp. 4-46]|uniref:PepSY domain-containing protein n=1 Tax=unclassified Methylobacterium TaxID=2615210 RepID=UPI000152E8AD|nr:MULTISPECIES: PepSY domain-containing protein [Methylobacterium]ACA19960.1 Propeptide PepSY amd peptidase M4 [Methylobacterium sp. 4-46]WFT79144.1 PepSY domain-containing protein [Methylobacterium nodulans]
MTTRLPIGLALLVLTTNLTLAQTAPTAPTTPAPAPAAPAPQTSPTPAPSARASGDLKEWEAAKASKIGLAQALATAESQGGQGGRAIDADFEKAKSNNPAHWEIKVVYPDGKLVEHYINADTGALIKSENQPIERYFTRLKVSDFQNAKTSLKDALAIAEQKAGGGKAFEAEVEREGSSVAYEISVALSDRSQKIKVGPDGKVID